MVNLTLAVPKEMKSEMEQFPEINWSEVARQAIAQKLRDMQLLKKMGSKSTLTEKDAINLGRKLNKAMQRGSRSWMSRE